MCMVQLYKEDWAILCMLSCWAVALLSNEQIVSLLARTLSLMPMNSMSTLMTGNMFANIVVNPLIYSGMPLLHHS